MHSGNPSTADELTATLVERGWLSVSGPGLIRAAGPFAALCSYFDRLFASLARRRGATPHSYPVLISRGLLDRLDYFTSFPGVATPAGETHVLSPAICYHTYEMLQGQRLPQQPYRVTAAGPCCRFEGDRLTASPERLWNFTMREIVFFGSAAKVAQERKALMRATMALLGRLGLTGALAPATDPFFVGESRGKYFTQKLKELKHELRIDVQSSSPLALASFNHHENFFTSRMNIGFADGTPAVSGCAAFGIERWSYAVLRQKGAEPAAWPPAVRRFVERHAAG